MTLVNSNDPSVVGPRMVTEGIIIVPLFLSISLEFFATLIYYFTMEEAKLINKYNKSKHKGDSFGHFLQYLIKEKDLYGFVPDGGFIDIGSLEDYKKANEDCRKFS